MSPSRRRKLPEPFQFFVDRGLGRGDVPSALRGAIEQGEGVHLHDDHFAQSTADVEWLTAVGERRWVVLSKDAEIRRNPLELDALLRAGVAAFLLSSGNLRGEDQGRALATALPRIRRALRRSRVPIIATVGADGIVSVLWEDGAKLERARRVK